MRAHRALVAFSVAVLAISVVAVAAVGLAETTTVMANDFEDGTTQGWFGRGDAVVSVSEDQAHSGSSSLLTSGRTATWQGPGKDMLSVLKAGGVYQIEAYVRTVSGDDLVTMTVQRTPSGGSASYDTVAWQVPVSESEWTLVGGSYTFDSEVNTELQMYLESPNAELEYYLDDVSVVVTTPPPGGTEIIVETGFETETNEGWVSRGPDEEVVVTGSDAHEGSFSLLTSGRTSAWNGPAFVVTSFVEAGETYEFSMWVKLAPDEEPSDLRFSIQRDYEDADTTYTTVIPDTRVTAEDWVNLKGAFGYTTEASAATVYVESAEALVDFYLDDFQMSVQIPPEIEDIPPLKDVLSDYFPIGAAVDDRETAGAPAELLTRHFNQITAENHMKPESIQPTEGDFTFDTADALVEFAQTNGMGVYGHTLVWHSQTPDWFFQDENGDPLTNSPEDQAIALARMEAHINAVAEHFGDQVWAWDVVNEAIDESQADGLRRSPWYNILGPDYLAQAFVIAREAFGPDVKLFLNDYNTEFPAKREAMYEVVERLIADGVPIDGIGHQLHLNLVRPVSWVDESLTRFSDLGLLQAVTELDVSISASTSESLPTPPPDRIIQQGYYYRDLFEILRAHGDDLVSVTVWGLYDARSWLKTWPIDRPHEAPLLFDNLLQSKPAYWGIVDSSTLPHYPRTARVAEGSPVVDGERELVWDMLPPVILKAGEEGGVGTGFQLRWDAENLYLLAEIDDATLDSGDVVDVFVDDTNAKLGTYGPGDNHYSISRDGSASDGLAVVVKDTPAGYRVEARLPLLTSAEVGREIGFDIRVLDASIGDPISWSDQNHLQDTDTSRWGTITTREAFAQIDIPYAVDSPAVDGVVDDVWSEAVTVVTDILVEGSSEGAKGEFSVLWDGTRLFVLAKVSDPTLDSTNSNAWEQDSVEVFVDPGNTKAGAYKSTDGQYRISFENLTSVNGDQDLLGDALESVAVITEGGYLVELSIELVGMIPEAGAFVGLEFQINDATDGARTAVHTWYDPTGQSYQDTSGWGIARLVEPTSVCDVVISGFHRGPLTIREGVTCLEKGAFVLGPVTVLSGGSLRTDGGKIIGALTTSRADAVILEGLQIVGPVTIAKTGETLSIVDNQILGPVMVLSNNTGETPIVISANTVKGILACFLNKPAPTDNGSPNEVSHLQLGQCKGF